MNIDWQHFSPGASLAGGILIGLAVTLLLLTNARIAGISGIIAGLLQRWGRETSWRLAFLAGLLLSSFLWDLTVPGGFPPYRQHPADPLNWILMALGGLLVGLGTRIANGCTSGHGVCGLARLSLRSLVAVLTFMASGVATVSLLNWAGRV
jgi:uncharacterized membrane protein YedE/YeeE